MRKPSSEGVRSDQNRKDTASVLSCPDLFAMTTLSQKIDKAVGYLSWGKTSRCLHMDLDLESCRDTQVPHEPQSLSLAMRSRSRPKNIARRHLSWHPADEATNYTRDLCRCSAEPMSPEESDRRRKSEQTIAWSTEDARRGSFSVPDLSTFERGSRSSTKPNPSTMIGRARSLMSKSGRPPRAIQDPAFAASPSFSFSPFSSIRNRKAAKVINP